MAAQPSGIRIGELMKRAGVSRATVHHYVREGLLPEPVKTSRNMALYAPECVDRVLLIKSLQQEHRRSLAEVRALLENADGREAVRRLKARVDAEVPADFAQPGTTGPVLRADVAEQSGFSLDELDDFAAHGLITWQVKDGERLLRVHDMAVVEALVRLRDAGFDREHGFRPQDAALYLEVLQDLLRREVQIFLQRSAASEQPDELVARAERGIRHVTPLLLALRRKVIRELLDRLPMPDRDG